MKANHPRLILSQMVKGEEIYIGKVCLKANQTHAEAIKELAKSLPKSRLETSKIDTTGAMLVKIF